MKNMTLTKFFADGQFDSYGCLTLDKAWAGDYFSLPNYEKMTGEQLNMLNQICGNYPGNISAVYDFLSEEDELFRNIYSESFSVGGEEHFVYPFVEQQAIPDDVVERVGPIGLQTSMYHQESLREHVALVAANLVDAGVDRQMAAYLAVLHDVGKKYTAATNKKGEISFFNHAPLSAFITGRWLRSVDEPMAKTLVAVIYAHTRAHFWKKKPDDRQKYFGELLAFYGGDEQCAEKAMSLIEKLNVCDEGVTEFTPKFWEKVERGESLIRACKTTPDL